MFSSNPYIILSFTEFLTASWSVSDGSALQQKAWTVYYNAMMKLRIGVTFSTSQNPAVGYPSVSVVKPPHSYQYFTSYFNDLAIQQSQSPPPNNPSPFIRFWRKFLYLVFHNPNQITYVDPATGTTYTILNPVQNVMESFIRNYLSSKIYDHPINGLTISILQNINSSDTINVAMKDIVYPQNNETYFLRMIGGILYHISNIKIPATIQMTPPSGTPSTYTGHIFIGDV
jgi:hypothetical protein